MSEYMATSPLIEAGNVYLPHPMYVPWVNDFIEECAAFPVRDLAVAIATRGADWTMLLAVEAEGPNRQVSKWKAACKHRTAPSVPAIANTAPWPCSWVQMTADGRDF